MKTLSTSILKGIITISIFTFSLIGNAQVKLPNSLAIPVTLEQNISSQNIQKGDLVQFTTMQDIYYGKNLIPAGTKAFAEVTKSNKRKCWGKLGRITLSICYLQLKGEKIKLQAPVLEKEGISKKGKAWTWFGCTVFFVPLNIIPALCIKGEESILEAGTTIIAYPCS